MTEITGKNLNIKALLAVSFLLHLAAFGVTAAMQSKAQPSVAMEYLPVELVQLPATPRDVQPAPAAARSEAAPRPLEMTAPVLKREAPESTPAQVAQRIAPAPQLQSEAPAAGMSLKPRSAAAPGDGAKGKEGAPAVGNLTPSSRPGAAASQPLSLKPGKGSYQAFYRLTKIPSLRSRAEPVYPNTERMTGNEARVQVEIYLDERGAVDDVTIKKSGGRLFDKAVIDAVRRSTFHPGYMGEKAVPTVIQIPYSFKLR